MSNQNDKGDAHRPRNPSVSVDFIRSGHDRIFNKHQKPETKPERQQTTIIDEKQQSELLEAARPLMQFLEKNCHPHCRVIVDSESAELTEGIVRILKPTSNENFAR